MKKKKETTSVYFLVASICAAVVLLLPLFLSHIPTLSSRLNDYLDAIQSEEHRKLYLNAVATLFGTFLGVTGAVWAQNIANKQREKENNRNNAQFLLFDLKSALDVIKKAYEERSYSEDSLEYYKAPSCSYHLSVLPDWRQRAVAIGEQLGDQILYRLIKTYATINEISSMIYQLDDGVSLRRFKKLCSLLIDETSLQNNKEIDEIIDTLTIISSC